MKARTRSKVTVMLPALMIVAALVLLPMMSGCGDEDQDRTGTVTTGDDQSLPASGHDGENGGAAGDDDASADEDGAEDGAAGAEDDGGAGVEIVSEHTDYGPCEDGQREVTHYVEYSDSTAAGSASLEPCE